MSNTHRYLGQFGTRQWECWALWPSLFDGMLFSLELMQKPDRVAEDHPRAESLTFVAAGRTRRPSRGGLRRLRMRRSHDRGGGSSDEFLRSEPAA